MPVLPDTEAVSGCGVSESAGESEGEREELKAAPGESGSVSRASVEGRCVCASARQRKARRRVAAVRRAEDG
jgi:hypothetical protein